MNSLCIQTALSFILLTCVKGFNTPGAGILFQEKSSSFMRLNSHHENSQSVPSRRQAIENALGSVSISLLLLSRIEAANAIDACPKGSKNCLRQTWTAPTSNKEDAASTLRKVIQSYPQEGQNDVDGGGFTIVSDDLPKQIQVEYRSSGKGKFAKIFNGGRPFVDDLVVEIEDSSGEYTVFQVRSSSRVGDSDFGVNQKRLSYLFGELKSLGWKGKGYAN